MNWVKKHYDINDEKITWRGSITDDFTDDLIIVTLKKSSTYPRLNLDCFDLENATIIEYPLGATPPEHYYQLEYNELLERFRQLIFIYLEPSGKEKVIESIRKLEELQFVKEVNHNYIQSGT